MAQYGTRAEENNHSTLRFEALKAVKISNIVMIACNLGYRRFGQILPPFSSALQTDAVCSFLRNVRNYLRICMVS
jgi:hypothetical protein